MCWTTEVSSLDLWQKPASSVFPGVLRKVLRRKYPRIQRALEICPGNKAAEARIWPTSLQICQGYERSYTSTTPYALMSCTRATLL